MVKAPRGTQDIFGNSSAIWQRIEATAIKLFNEAGFQEIRTPIFESSELFSRAVGESSDIVNKEMYTFNDRSERSLTLRPEGTAGVVRAFIENSFDREGLPAKLWYRGPMFRYERPQTGRYRQFHQIGIEAIGAKAPYIDLEIIKLGVNFIQDLGLTNLTLHINSLGNSSSRENYIAALKVFLKESLEHVCEDCQRRYEQNPLRCLDCKVPEDQKIYQNAPTIIKYLDEESQKIWQETQNGLTELGIKYQIDEKLVRGLDYYTHVVFELKTKSEKLAGQNTVLAGGRYDNLVKNLGGGDYASVGWALGIERIATLIEETHQISKLYIISDSPIEALKLADKLRLETKKIAIELAYEETKFKKQLEKAIKRDYQWALFYLSEERNSGLFKLKNLRENKEYDKLDYSQVLELL
jgi:histidyl-tRNA synthetase